MKNIRPTVIEITAADMDKESRRHGVDPNRWNYRQTADGMCEIRRGVWACGQLIFEEHAALLVNALNKQQTN
jgi:hypothetical protein